VATIGDPEVKTLLDKPNHAVVSTVNEDGTIHSTVAWVNVESGRPAVNSEASRKWPRNLARDPRVTVLIYDESNPYEYVEIRGTAASQTEGADGHIDRLAKKYLGQDTYPFHQPGEQRVSFLIAPAHIRHQKQ